MRKSRLKSAQNIQWLFEHALGTYSILLEKKEVLDMRWTFRSFSDMNFLGVLDSHRYTEELKDLSETFKVTQLPMQPSQWKE